MSNTSSIRRSRFLVFDGDAECVAVGCAEGCAERGGWLCVECVRVERDVDTFGDGAGGAEGVAG